MGGAGVRTGLSRLNVEVPEAVRLLSEYGLASVRRKKRGEITHVKHVTLGWMSASEWVTYRGVKTGLATYGPALIRAGYEMKAWIWGTEINLSLEFIASGAAISIPGFVVVVLIAFAIAAADFAEGNPFYGWLDLAAIALPFGELWLFYRGIDLVLTLPQWITKVVGQTVGSQRTLQQIAANTATQDASIGGLTTKIVSIPAWAHALSQG